MFADSLRCMHALVAQVWKVCTLELRCYISEDDYRRLRRWRGDVEVTALWSHPVISRYMFSLLMLSETSMSHSDPEAGLVTNNIFATHLVPDKASSSLSMNLGALPLHDARSMRSKMMFIDSKSSRMLTSVSHILCVSLCQPSDFRTCRTASKRCQLLSCCDLY